MNEFTIYCTPEQTRKALELGAPIKTDVKVLRGHFSNDSIFEDGNLFVWKPTAEEMIGWLEEQGIREVSLHHLKDVWHICIYLDNGDIIPIESFYLSRTEATLAAIDAALEYLANNKK